MGSEWRQQGKFSKPPVSPFIAAASIINPGVYTVRPLTCDPSPYLAHSADNSSILFSQDSIGLWDFQPHPSDPEAFSIKAAGQQSYLVARNLTNCAEKSLQLTNTPQIKWLVSNDGHIYAANRSCSPPKLDQLAPAVSCLNSSKATVTATSDVQYSFGQKPLYPKFVLQQKENSYEPRYDGFGHQISVYKNLIAVHAWDDFDDPQYYHYPIYYGFSRVFVYTRTGRWHTRRRQLQPPDGFNSLGEGGVAFGEGFLAVGARYDDINANQVVLVYSTSNFTAAPSMLVPPYSPPGFQIWALKNKIFVGRPTAACVAGGVPYSQCGSIDVYSTRNGKWGKPVTIPNPDPARFKRFSLTTFSDKFLVASVTPRKTGFRLPKLVYRRDITGEWKISAKLYSSFTQLALNKVGGGRELAAISGNGKHLLIYNSTINADGFNTTWTVVANTTVTWPVKANITTIWRPWPNIFSALSFAGNFLVAGGSDTGDLENVGSYCTSYSVKNGELKLQNVLYKTKTAAAAIYDQTLDYFCANSDIWVDPVTNTATAVVSAKGYPDLDEGEDAVNGKAFVFDLKF